MVQRDVEAHLLGCSLDPGVSNNGRRLEIFVHTSVEVQVCQSSIVDLQVDGPPWTTGVQDRTPVPPELVLSLANTEPRVVTVPTSPLVVRVLLHLLPAPQIRTLKGNDQLVLAGLDRAGHIHSLRGEHVVRHQHCLPIEHHGSKGIQSIKRQHGLASLVDLATGESRAVDPGLLPDPLHVELILAHVGVWDELVVQEIQMDVGGELGHGEELGRGIVGLLEVPVLVDGDDLAWCHLAVRPPKYGLLLRLLLLVVVVVALLVMRC